MNLWRRNNKKRNYGILIFGCVLGTISSFSSRAAEPEKSGICFAMYTVQDQTMKMMVQLYPLADGDSREVKLQVQKTGAWKTIATEMVRETSYGNKAQDKAWNLVFRVENWDPSNDWNYRVVARGGASVYSGLIRKDPIDKNEIVVAAFTGNSNRDRRMKPDIIANVKAHDVDLLFFAGDQSYDHKTHLKAWLLFGEQFGEIIKDRPTIAIPDDHDVGQGNLWGAAGKQTHKGGGDDGGYFMPVQYVNEVQFAQTANLPDPFDPTPVERGITVYYTSLNVGGVDFAILEDRKFKTGPAGLVQTPGHKRADLMNDPEFDVSELDVPGTVLLGDRQLGFLREWTADWTGTEMKAVLSQTIFAQAAHKTGRWFVIADLDSNGWPQTGRNKALSEIRKGYAFMLAGDQHLGTVLQHGVDDWGDAGFSFCVPSIVNFWPRSWLPKEKGVNPMANGLEHTGQFKDGFGNKVTMYAYSNPNEEWKEIGTKEDPFAGGAAGHGIVRFNKEQRTITMECWPRNSDVSAPDAKPFPGWPVTIHQEENYGRKAVAWLPLLRCEGMNDPVVQVINEKRKEVVYTLRINGSSWQPKVFEEGLYTIRVGEGDSVQTFSGVQSALKKDNVITVKIAPGGGSGMTLVPQK